MTFELPTYDQVSSVKVGREYLKAATSAAREASETLDRSGRELAVIFAKVRASGLAIFAEAKNAKEAAKSTAGDRSTAFSRWYSQFDYSRQDANKLANWGDQLIKGLPVANVGQSRAITAAGRVLARADATSEDWQDTLAGIVDTLHESGDMTAAAIKSAANQAAGIVEHDEADETIQHRAERPAPKVETLEAFVRFLASDVAGSAASVSGDLSGFTAAEWKAVSRKLGKLVESVGDYRLARDRKDTAPSV